MKFEHLNLTHLKYFLDTVETLSFTTASEINNVSRPAISQGIKRLEDLTGIRLFIHQKNSLQLTNEGQDFYRSAKGSFEAFKRQFQEQVLERNILKVGCSASLIESFLIPTLKGFKNLPQIEIKVGNSIQLKHFLEQGIVNIAIFIDPTAGSFKSETIYEGQFVLISKNGKLGDLLILTEDRAEVSSLKNYLYNKGIEPKIIQAESWGLAIKLADSLGGACLVPDILVKNTNLKRVRLNGYKITYNAFLAHRRKELLSVAELSFCEHFKMIPGLSQSL